MTWNRMLPHHYISWLNTKLLAEHGHENASGIIMSAWCDGGMSLREENWLGIYAGALYSWNCDTGYTFEEFVKSYYQLFFGIDVDMEQYQRLMNYDYNFITHPYDEKAYEGRIEFWYDKWQNAGTRFFQEFWKDATLPADAKLQEKLQGSEKIFEDAYAYFSGLDVKRNRQAYEAFLFDIKRSAVAARKVAMLTDKPYHSREEAMQMIPAIDRMIQEVTELLEENKVQWFACNRNSEWDYLESKYLELIESFRSLKRYCRYGKTLGEVKRI